MGSWCGSQAWGTWLFWHLGVGRECANNTKIFYLEILMGLYVAQTPRDIASNLCWPYTIGKVPKK